MSSELPFPVHCPSCELDNRESSNSQEGKLIAEGPIPILSIIRALGLDLQKFEPLRSDVSEPANSPEYLHYVWSRLIEYWGITPPKKSPDCAVDSPYATVPQLLPLDSETLQKFKSALDSREIAVPSESPHRELPIAASPPPFIPKSILRREAGSIPYVPSPTTIKSLKTPLYFTPTESQKIASADKPSVAFPIFASDLNKEEYDRKIIPCSTLLHKENSQIWEPPLISKGSPSRLNLDCSAATLPPSRNEVQNSPDISEGSLLQIVQRHLKGISPQYSEGRTLQAFANQIIHAEASLVPLKSTQLITKIVSLIQDFGKSGMISISRDGTRFGLWIPSSIDVTSLPIVSEMDLQRIWDLLSKQLLATTKFTACVNAINNSYGPWKTKPNQKELATAAVIHMIKRHWI